MNVAYQKRWPLYLSTKNTILKKYDGRSIFNYHTLSIFLEIVLNPCMAYTEISLSLLAGLSHISGLKTFSKKTMKKIGEASLRRQEYGMSICSIEQISI
jgi:hypothetical protein